ncbi:MAG: T9SS type A sorting domain-containing protein, partial [Ignavibacteriaceae bacterium]|nr:T9SS type A sorting domain-containing protein [Ignavibacteriaceae bacterium]
MHYSKILFIFFCSSILIFPSHHTIVLTPSVTSSFYYCTNSTYGSSTNISYGGQDYLNNHYYYESVYKFSFATIPPNACNISATLEAYRTSGSIDGIIKKVPNDLDFTNYTACYSAVDIGAPCFHVDPSSGTQHDVTSFLGGTIDPNGNINFGVASTVLTGLANISIKLTINYDLLLNVSFQNNFISVGNGGTIIANSIQYNSPATGFQIIEGGSITGAAQDQTFTDINYTFTGWYSGTSLISTERTYMFSPGVSTTYSAHFLGKPTVTNRNLHYNASNPKQPITVLWSEHPSTGVTQYQIWRRVKYDKQPTGSPALIGTVNRGTFSFVDYDYAGTNLGFTKWILWYDVRPYYSVEQTYSDSAWALVFSNGPLAKDVARNKENSNELVTENKIENYPNPFNPSTVITYQIVNPGHVSIKVYNCLGKEIADLVNEEQNTGKYKVLFNVDNLASGIYFYRIVANGY